MSTTMYSPLVYPLTSPGAPYSMPATPASFIQQVFSPVNWNPYSANSTDRTFYWSDTNGTLTEEQVLALTIGASGVAKNMIGANQVAYTNAVTNGFNALGYNFLLNAEERADGLATFTSSHSIIANAKPWSNGSAVTAFSSSIIVNGNYYTCVQSGITGASQPVLGTTFGQTYTDGSAGWQYAGFLLTTSSGNIWFTVQQIVQIYGQVVQYIATNKNTLTNLTNQINNVASAPSTWTADSTIVLNSYVVINSVLYQATTAGITGSALPTWNTTTGSTTSDGTVVWTCLGNQIAYIQSLAF